MSDTSAANQTRLSVTEFAVLGLLAEGPNHGFAIARELESEAEVGQVFTVRRPLVYRALDRLVEAGLAQPITTEKGDAGPRRVVLDTTDAGRERLVSWLARPVDHVRDLRLVFLLKVALIDRAGDSPLDLIRAQRTALGPKLEALDERAAEDHVELWRRHNANAALAYLDDLESIYDAG